MRDIDLHNQYEISLKLGIKVIVYLGVVTLILGNLIDIYAFYDTTRFPVVIKANTISIAAALIIGVLYYFQFINAKVGLGGVIFTLLINSLLSLDTTLSETELMNDILRELIFTTAVIPLASFVIHRHASYAVTILFFSFVYAVAIVTDSKLIFDLLPIVFIVLALFSFLISFFANILKNVIEELSVKNIVIKEQIEEIKAQNEELIQQKEEIMTQNDQIENVNVKLSEINLSLEDRTDELHELNETKNRFFSIIAHDLKSPLNGILGFTHLLKSRYEKITDEKRMLFINSIHTSSERLHQLLENLLYWSRSQLDTIKVKKIEAFLNIVVDENMQVLSDVSKKKNISIVNGVSETLVVIADLDIINTVIRNLVSNSIKFTPDNGVITITAEEKDDTVVVCIRDTGIGIPAEKVDSLFRIDKGFQREGTNKEKGTGLGLAICKEFIAKNGGEIWVESTEGVGSKFYFTLKRKK